MLQTILTGALAGAVATAPMSVFMEAAHRALPEDEDYPLPPSEITSHLEEQVGLQEKIDRGEHTALTLFNHFAYGAACGAIYAPVAGTVARNISPALSGTIFGLGVWTVSYLGLLPSLNILQPATRHPMRRNLLMIVAHVIWGSVTGLITARLEER